MKTELCYLNNTYRFTCKASIVDMGEDERGKYIVVDKTIFHPKGGGQPSDIGTIKSKTSEFEVNAVVLRDGRVFHYGNSTIGNLRMGHQVALGIHALSRVSNARYHTAGHLIAYAGNKLYPKLHAQKGNHDPTSAYIDFQGHLLDDEIEHAAAMIESIVNEMIRGGSKVEIKWEEKDGAILRYMCVPGVFEMPCGGTHIQSLDEVGEVKMKKVKKRGEYTRVSYLIVSQ